MSLNHDHQQRKTSQKMRWSIGTGWRSSCRTYAQLICTTWDQWWLATRWSDSENLDDRARREVHDFALSCPRSLATAVSKLHTLKWRSAKADPHALFYIVLKMDNKTLASDPSVSAHGNCRPASREIQRARDNRLPRDWRAELTKADQQHRMVNFKDSPAHFLY